MTNFIQKRRKREEEKNIYMYINEEKNPSFETEFMPKFYMHFENFENLRFLIFFLFEQYRT